jgi:predicted O-linked N-acetylglucosamine transferase (SPINDLY family)
MIANHPLAISSNWHQQAYQCLLEKNYIQAASLYEQAVTAEPEVKSHYWYLGLVLLLQGQEAEAQTTWLFGMAEGEAEQIEQWTQELIQVLETEAERRRLELEDYAVAWAIRQHIREINPTDINNLLHLTGLYIWLETYTGKEPTELGLIDLLKEKTAIVDSDLLLQVIKSVLDCAPLISSSLDLTEASLVYIQDTALFINQLLLPLVYKISYSARRPGIAAKFTELGLQLVPEDPELVCSIASFYQDSLQFDKGIESAKKCLSLRTKLAEQVFANHLIMRGLMSAGGYWQEFCETTEQQKLLLNALLKEQPTDLSESTTHGLFNTVFFFPYFQDNPEENTQLRSQVSKLAQLNIEIYAQKYIEKYRNRPTTQSSNISVERRLKIGYISHCFRSHSVGWLARGLFQHHDREHFELHGYFIGYDSYTYNPMQDWYVNQMEKAHQLGLTSLEAAEKIYEDEIDILVDLDSMTLTTTCEVMALQSAPIQVTWLGWDASGIPAIDYYIADPYVLPENAQEYYSEKIWRLPQTYLAVDGFELGLPNLRRDQLDIPDDGVIYFSSQRGYKYNPNTVRLQMQIIKEVPNSYFLIKGVGDEESLKNFFIQFAEAEGVHPEQLRFLPLAISEQIHRANLAIADVVLDTYPYNGATTTMEILWMGIPMVTRVGQQFAARNSYTMMMNAGITEGIAWTDEEYVEWGIKLGTDENLRQQIAWKLRKNRQTAPLWNGKQFTREMENAYEQMWQKYIEGKN